MKRRFIESTTIASGLIFVVGVTLAAEDKYAVQVPNGLALAECRSYEDWSAVAASQPEDPEDELNLIVANSAMIDAYRAGIPDNGKPFPEGPRIVKILWNPIQHSEAPYAVKSPDILTGVCCMLKDSERFPDTGGWGYAQFDYGPATDAFIPNTSLQGNDATFGHACHTIVEARDFVITRYAKR